MYRALIDADTVAAWRVPEGMNAVVHVFDARVGGRFRVSLTYETPHGRGKTGAHTDTYHGLFIDLVPNERVVEELEFETSDPAFAGPMRITTTLADADGGTDMVVLHEGVPPGVSAHHLGQHLLRALISSVANLYSEFFFEIRNRIGRDVIGPVVHIQPRRLLHASRGCSRDAQ